MKKIQLTQGRVALVDNADYSNLSCHKWFAHQNDSRYAFYARRCTGGTHNRKAELMHRIILGLRFGDRRQCDHIDGNGLNNQRSNLRICTPMQNVQSSRKRKLCSSKYKGVYRDRSRRKWHSRIVVNKKRVDLGRFESETNAALAYNHAALKHFGQFALLNTL